MIVFIGFDASSYDIEHRVIDQLRAIYPAGISASPYQVYFNFRESETHEAWPRLRKCLHDAGIELVFEPNAATDPQRQVIARRLRREYVHADFEGLEYLQVDGMLDMISDGRGKGDPPEWINGRSLRASHDFVHAITGACVPERIRRELEAEVFAGLEFKPVRVIYTPGNVVEVPAAERASAGKWWRLWSTIELPPCSPYLELRNNAGELLPRDSIVGHLVEPGFSDVELRWVRSELATVGPFDIARTRRGHGLVVSRRFYEFCVARGWKAVWRPVRIDEG